MDRAADLCPWPAGVGVKGKAEFCMLITEVEQRWGIEGDPGKALPFRRKRSIHPILTFFFFSLLIHYFLEPFYVHGKIEREDNKDFSIYSLPPYTQPPPLSTSPIRVVHVL